MKNQSDPGGTNIAAGSVAAGGSQAYSNLIASLLRGSTNSSSVGGPNQSSPHAGNKDLVASTTTTTTAAAAKTSTSQPRISLPGNGSRMLAPAPAYSYRATYNHQRSGGTGGDPSAATSTVTSNTSAGAASISSQGVVQQLLASLQHPQQPQHSYGDQSRAGTTTTPSSVLADLVGRSTAGVLGSDAASLQLQPQHPYTQGNMGIAATKHPLNDVLMLLQQSGSGSNIGGLDPATAALLSILGRGGTGASLAAGTGGLKHSAAASVESRTITSSSLDNTTQPRSNVTSQRGDIVQQSSPQPAKGTALLGNTTFTTADDTIASTDAKKDASSTKLSDRAASASLPASGGAPSIAESANSGKLFKNVLPCRARGMPLDHNFSNAFFIVTQDTKHGDHLVCSFPKCRNGGVKFRYCSVCRIPVAQRNFYRRHSHQDIIMTKNDGVTSNPIKSAKKKSSSSNSSAKNPAALDMRKNEDLHQDIIKKALKQSGILQVSGGAAPLESHVAAVPTKSKSRKGKILENADQDQDKSKGGKGLRRKRSSSQDPEDPVALLALNMSQLPRYQKEELVDPARRRAWTLLLLNRPDPSDDLGMSAWLMHVMSVSDSSNKVNLEKLERLYGVKPTEAPALLAARAAEQMILDRWRQKDATKDRSRSSNSRKEKKTKILHKPAKEDAADSSLSDSAEGYAEARKELDQVVPSLEATAEIQADHQETQVEDSRDGKSLEGSKLVYSIACGTHRITSHQQRIPIQRLEIELTR